MKIPLIVVFWGPNTAHSNHVNVIVRDLREPAVHCDMNRVRISLGEIICFPSPDIEMNLLKKLSKKAEFAESFSKGCVFLWEDFYYMNGATYFDETIFYLNSGFGMFKFEKWNSKIDGVLELPVLAKQERTYDIILVRKEVRLCV